MFEGYLPAKIYNALKKYLKMYDLNEIRLRVGSPIILVIKNKKYYLGEHGLCDKNRAIICEYNTLQEFIHRICDNSIYSVNDYLKTGYIMLANGLRVGVAGEVVSENGQVKTIKNFQSVNIRIPHNIDGCSLFALGYIIKNSFLNTLIISPPGAGKTTFIRDVVIQISKKNMPYNILIADERNEIANVVDGNKLIDLGDNTDIYTYCSKEYAFKYGIRSMRPDIIVTDEIDLDKDMQAIVDACNSGVKVIASIHAKSISQLKLKRGFDFVLNNRIFDRYIVLSCEEGPGTLVNIYDDKLQCIYAKT